MNPRWKSSAAQVAALLVIASGLVVWAWAAEVRALGETAAPLDDTYIHLRFAWNLAHHGGFAFNPGRPLSGTTSPLWVLLLVPITLFGKSAAVVGAVFISMLSFLAVPLLTRRLGLRIGLSPMLAFAAGGAAALNGRLLFAGLSGMETDLFAALALALVTLRIDRAAQGRGMGAMEGALFGIATLVRPEGYLLFLVASLHHLASARARENRWRPPLAAAALFAAAVAPYIIFSLVTTGHPLPSTWGAKRADLVRDRLRYLEWTARYLWLDGPTGALAFAAASVLGLYRLARRPLARLAEGRGLVESWALSYLIASTMLTPMPFHFLRYQLPLLPFFFLMVAGLLDELAGWAAPRLTARGWTRLGRTAALVPALAGLWLLPSAAAAPRWPAVISRAAGNILEMHVRSGRWLKRARLPEDKVATMDIGAIGFYSEAEVIDLIGLVTPEIVPEVRKKGVTVKRSEAVARFLAGPRPVYLAIFPELYPGLIDRLDFCAPALDVRIRDNQIAAHDHLTIYRCAWPDD